MAGGYRASSSHLQTMDVLGKTRTLGEVTKDDLVEYCNMIMDEEYTAFSADDISLELWKRYKWNLK